MAVPKDVGSFSRISYRIGYFLLIGPHSLIEYPEASLAIFLKSSKLLVFILKLFPFLWSKTITYDPKAINPTILVLFSIFILLTSSFTASVTQSSLEEFSVTLFPILGETSITKMRSWSSVSSYSFFPPFLFLFGFSKIIQGLSSFGGLYFFVISLWLQQNSHIQTYSLVERYRALTCQQQPHHPLVLISSKPHTVSNSVSHSA